MVYHNKDTSAQNTDALPKKTSIELILFLSQLLMDAKTQYRPMELETAGLVWTIKKVCNMVELAKTSTIVYTDHAAIVLIAGYMKLMPTTATDKLNLEIIWASKYLQRSNLDVCHKPGKTHIILNALFCLASCKKMAKSTAKGKLETLAATVQEIWANPATLQELSNDFKKKLKMCYENNPSWKCVQNIVTINNGLKTNTAKLSYQIKDDLIYYKDPNLEDRLCIPGNKELLKQVLNQVHDKISHVRYAQTHQ